MSEILWWSETEEKITKILEVDPNIGLSPVEANNRLKKYGPNTFSTTRGESFWKRFLTSFTDPLVITLLVAALLSAFSETSQTFWILAIVVFMSVVSLTTDAKAKKALKSLQEVQKNISRVRRNGKLVMIEAKDLVVGDILVLNEGDKICADARIISAQNCQVDESILTGESLPVDKNSLLLPKETVLISMNNMIFSGTFVASGNLTAVITNIGKDTQMGKIALIVTSTESSQTPLQKQLEKLGKTLMFSTLALSLIVVGVYVIRGVPLLTALLSAIALAIAFIPEALGGIMVIALALGVAEMVKEKVIIRRLSAVEALGSVGIICTDKTGTITLGKMKAQEVWTVDGKKETKEKLMAVIRDCNNFIGATEIALGELLPNHNQLDRVAQVPFNSERKFMVTVHKEKRELIVKVKGAPEKILEKSVNKDYKKILEKIKSFEDQGFRVIGFAQKEVKQVPTDLEEVSDFSFLGLVILSDPPREEVFETVKLLYAAGVSPKIITGDSPNVAMSIAKKVGIIGDVITGDELKNLGEKDLMRITSYAVFARVDPEDKQTIIKAFQRSGYIVAMTGDGVNDAPGIVAADIGIAIGTGVDLTRDVADVVLTGSYQALASAVKVGRLILHRVRLYLHAILSTNGAEVGIFITAVIFDWPLPLTAIQLLVINLLGDSWLSMALVTEKAEPDILKDKPRKISDGIISKFMWESIIFQSILTTVIISSVYFFTKSSSAVFAIFMFQKIFRSAFTARSFRRNIWEYGFFTNKWSLVAASISGAITLLAIYVMPLGMKPIKIDLLFCLLLIGLIPAIIEEIIKYVRKHLQISLKAIPL